jgi:oligopeptide transport system substrate-binding protein
VKGRLALLVVGILLTAACAAPLPPSQPKRLAASQVLRLVAPEDVGTLDPAKVSQPTVDLDVVRNVFGGLYRFDDQLGEQDDLATGKPSVSPDGLTWTFRLRKDALFSNGDPVRANDVMYSWSRTAALTKYDNSVIFESVAGYQDLVAGRSNTLAGLSAPDADTVVAHLSAPAGWWLVELGLWGAAIVDQRVIREHGENDWWRTPENLVGTGPFKMSSRTPGSLDFVPVSRWWRGSTGNLTRIHVSVVADTAAQVQGYSDNLYDIFGYTPATTSTGQTPIDPAIRRYLGGGELQTRPWLRTSFIGFPTAGNLSPMAPDATPRQALSLALDRTKLAKDLCSNGLTCAPATGGLIPTGLAGNLGVGNDPFAAFNLDKARALLAAWDPDGSRRKGLRVGTYAAPQFRALASAVVAQWREGLGLDLKVQAADGPTTQLNTLRGLYDITITGFVADYNSPHDWFANISPSCAYAQNSKFVALTMAADAKLPIDALPQYRQAAQLLADDAGCPALIYLEGLFLIKPWVSGAGGNALYEFDWIGIKIFEH